MVDCVSRASRRAAPRGRRRRPTGRAGRAAAASAVLLGVALLACGGPADGPSRASRRGQAPVDDLETVEVAGPLDAELSTAADEQARGVGSHVAGVLPGGFPRDLPLPRPSTIVDFGQGAGGRSFVVLHSPEAAAVLRPAWEGRLAAAGWTRAGTDWSRDGRRVSLRVEEEPPGSKVRIEYRPG